MENPQLKNKQQMTVEPAYFVCGFNGCLLEVAGKIFTRHKSNRIGGVKIDSWETWIGYNK